MLSLDGAMSAWCSDHSPRGATVQIITFDFHNTVAHCNSWFELEIRQLPAAVLAHLARQDVRSTSATLQEPATVAYRALRKQVIDTGGELSAQECVERTFDEIGHSIAPNAIAGAIDKLMRDCLVDLKPVPGVVATISAILDSGIPVGIISSAVYHPFLEWSLAEFGLLDRLAFVVTSASIGYYKSDPRIYRCAYGRAGAQLHLGVHIGDSPQWDVTMAQKAGLGTVLYAAGPDPRMPGRDDAEPDLILHSLQNAHKPLLKLLHERRIGVCRT